MAVKLALGETHIIQQTKQMLADEVVGGGGVGRVLGDHASALH